mgnify:CR=1 FL=1|jgi:tryptophan synthase alpha subunit
MISPMDGYYRVIETEVYEDFPRDPSKVGVEGILVPSSVITDKQLSDRDFRLSCLESLAARR